MKRTLKNVVMIVIILAMCTLMYYTMDYAKEHITSDVSMDNSSMQEMPTKPDESSEDENSTTDNNVPTKPEGEDSSSENMSMQEPPEKPEGEDTNTNMSNPPAKPEESGTNTEVENGTDTDANAGTNLPTNGNSEQVPDKPSGEMTQNNMMASTKELTTIYYVVFGVESLVMAITVMYLLMSLFNKKTFKETFENVDKSVIFILSVIILTAVITFSDTVITNNYFLNSSDTNESGKTSGSSSVTYSSDNEITEDTTISDDTFVSSSSDQNAILVSGGVEVTLSDITVEKTGDSDGGDNTSFYGMNSAILAKDGASLVIQDATITTNATGANGVFSYGGSATTNNTNSDGTKITISDSKITTTKDNSGGIMTTGGGITEALNLEINTSGTSSAAIRTDRGGGTVTVDGGTYTTTGQGSPAIYSTADVSVSNADLISKTSEGIVIEGKNSVVIDNVNLTDSNTKLNGQSTTYKNIFLYQSMSGDADTGNASFTAKNSNIITNNGDSFYVTNTTATITLENNKIVNNDSTGNFLRVKEDSWGNDGQNGGDVTLNMTNQEAVGNIAIDSISTLDMIMKDNSYFEGVINKDNTAKSIKLTLDETSKIKLTGDTYVTSLEDADTTYSNIDFNGYNLYVNGISVK